MSSEVVISADRVAKLTKRELLRFKDEHPESRKRFDAAQERLLAGVPMNWMLKWAGAHPIRDEATGFPLFAVKGTGARLTDVDGHEYVDFCLGDTGAMTGHSPPSLIGGLTEVLSEGLTLMLPTDWTMEAADLLAQRFGLAQWQFTVSATDANRFAIRMARALTGSPNILVFNHCYHGTVDEAFATLAEDGRVQARRFNLGPPVPLDKTTRVVEFNDVSGLERELAAGDVACVLTEPALTNVGIVLPEPGFHAQLRELCRTYGTLLVLDETHTICAGPGGFTREYGLQPDVLTIGKAIGGGVPAGAWGLSESVAERIVSDPTLAEAMVEGIGVGGTLAGNVLSAEAIALTLRDLLTEEHYDRMDGLAQRWAEGVQAVIHNHRLPWHVTRLGARAEYHFREGRPRTGSDLAAVSDDHLERYLRLYLMNRGILTTPFHNMALMSPYTSPEDVALHEEVFGAAIDELVD